MSKKNDHFDEPFFNHWPAEMCGWGVGGGANLAMSCGYDDNGGHSHISHLGFGMRNQVGAN